MFDSANGSFVLTLVGATIVGSMATAWHGVVNPPRPGLIREWDYRGKHIALKKGAEMGRFLLGSTVVLLFPRGPLVFNPAWTPARPGAPRRSDGRSVGGRTIVCMRRSS